MILSLSSSNFCHNLLIWAQEAHLRFSRYSVRSLKMTLQPRPSHFGQSAQPFLVRCMGFGMYFTIMVITTVYLCGPVENDVNAVDWRKWYTEKLLTIKDKFNRNLFAILDPLIKPAGLPKEAYLPQSKYWDALKRAQAFPDCPPGDDCKPNDITLYAAFTAMRACIDVCFEMVKESDVILCRLPKIFTVGTIEELVLAKQLKKTVLFACPEGIPSFWLLAEFATPKTINEVFFKEGPPVLGVIESDDLLQALTTIAKERNTNV